MNRITFMLTIILAIFMVLPSHYVWSIAKPGESLTVADGIYQVELSFLSLEAVEQEGIFNETATLTVKNNQYTLSIPIKQKKKMMAMTVNQNGGNIPFLLDRDENLVQFDVESLQQKILIEGFIEWSSEEIPILFSEQITIHTDGLPPIEELPPPPPVVEPGEEEEPSTPIVEDTLKEALINYVLLVDGTDEQSIMNTYVDPLIKLIKKDNKYYAQMKILKSSWLTGLKVGQQGKMIEPEMISLVDNTRIIHFEIRDFIEKVRLWVQVDIPELAYHHQYYVQLQLDEAQLSKFLGEAVKPGNSKPNKTPDKVIRKPKPKPVPKPIQQAETPKSEKYLSAMIPKPTLPLLEEILAFDRTLDEVIEKEEVSTEEETIEIEEVNQDPENNALLLERLDKVKIGLLVTICVLSGILLVLRIKKAKKASLDE